jgi:hypothetical protein
MGREEYAVDKQQRDEVAELILRAIRLQYEVGLADGTARLPVYERVTLQDNAHTAQREIWEALYRINLDQGQERP